MAIGLYTGMQQGATMVEDVTDLIVNVDYSSTPFYSSLAESQATNTLHQWLNDHYATSADNAASEGNDLVFTDLTEPSRSTNIVQLFQKDIRVSNTAQRVKHYGTGDPYAYQMTKRMTELARDIEKALVAGTRASGNSGVARRMDGAIALITTNKTTRASGTSLSETEFNDILQGVFDSGTDVNVDKAFVGSSLKRVISGYNGVPKTVQQVEAAGKKLFNTVSIYESDFGVVTVLLEREVPSTAGNRAVLATDTSKWRVAYLTDGRPQHIPLATIGSAKRGMLEAEITLEALSEKSSAFRVGYL
jgi:hypothetical protein